MQPANRKEDRQAETAACVQHGTMQDADAQHDQMKASKNMASPGRPSQPGTRPASARPDGRSAAASKPMSVAAVATQKDCTQTAKAPAARKPAPAAPTSKRQKTAGSKKAPAGRKAAAAESESESEAAGDIDADEPDAAAAASAAAEAASFTPDEVTEVRSIISSMTTAQQPHG